jgi:hypothetical protein
MSRNVVIPESVVNVPVRVLPSENVTSFTVHNTVAIALVPPATISTSSSIIALEKAFAPETALIVPPNKVWP